MAVEDAERAKIDPAWAWGRYEPDASRPWNLSLAGHLFRRAAFGENWDRLQEALVDGPQNTVDKLLHPESNLNAFSQTYDDYDIAASGGASAEGLGAWWLRRMIVTPHPLLEKMTLFWHSHFGISNAQVKNARLMQQHVQLLRKEALGSFGTMLRAIPFDPAVLLCLDSTANRKAMPNENFARALLENYTLGPGHFKEEDVAEAARAFTGWFVLRGKLKYIAREHDEGPKSILGRQANFAAADVVEIVLNQRVTSERIVRKLYRWLISETQEPADELIRPLAEAFSREHDISETIETILRSNLFFSQVAYRQRIKSPVEYAVGIVRGLESLVSTTQLSQALSSLGQSLYHPPTPKGFEGGRYWVNDIALTGRHNLAVAMLQGPGPYKDKLNPWAVATDHQYTSIGSAAKFILDLFLQGDIEQSTGDLLLERARIADSAEEDPSAAVLRRFTHSVVTLAQFNLA